MSGLESGRFGPGSHPPVLIHAIDGGEDCGYRLAGWELLLGGDAAGAGADLTD
jgi:hypothetical protein